jgi:predicted component of type VI protein secretion system
MKHFSINYVGDKTPQIKTLRKIIRARQKLCPYMKLNQLHKEIDNLNKLYYRLEELIQYQRVRSYVLKRDLNYYLQLDSSLRKCNLVLDDLKIMY